MRLVAVESANDLLLQSVGFGAVLGFRHSLREGTQFLWTEPARFPRVLGELNRAWIVNSLESQP